MGAPSRRCRPPAAAKYRPASSRCSPASRASRTTTSRRWNRWQPTTRTSSPCWSSRSRVKAGINVPDDGYLPHLRRMCDRHGWLLMLDEVQSGVGRTGQMVRAPAARHQARRHDLGQGPGQRHTDRRLSGGWSSSTRVPPRQSRLDLRRQSARLRRRLDHAQHHRGRGLAGQRGQHGRLHPQPAARTHLVRCPGSSRSGAKA